MQFMALFLVKELQLSVSNPYMKNLGITQMLETKCEVRFMTKKKKSLETKHMMKFKTQSSNAPHFN